MAGLDYIKAPYPVAERAYYVSPNFTVNKTAHQYPTIQSAIDAAYSEYGVITDLRRVVIHVAPGVYEEQIHSYAGYHILGDTENTTTDRKVATLENSGIDSSTYPLRSESADYYEIENFNIHANINETIGIVPNGKFTNCAFQGKFIERPHAGNSYTAYDNCRFYNAYFDLSGTNLPGRRNINIKKSWFLGESWIITSTHDTQSNFWIEDCIFKRCAPNYGGDFNMQITSSRVFGNDRFTIGTSADLAIFSSTVSCGMHFTADPSNTTIQDCNFNDNEGYPITNEDITAAVTITNVNYVGNIQYNGISGKIQTTGDVVNVGGDSISRYYTIQDAIDSLPTGGVVSLSPQTYTEQIHSTGNVHIQGRTHEGVPAVKSTVLYNTGADAAHYPLGGDDTDVFTISDITIKTDAGAVIGKLSASNFTGCVFENGHFIEATANQAMLMGLVDCSFENSMAFNLTGVGSGGMRAMTIIGCYFNDHATHWVMNSTHTTTLAIVKNSIFHNFFPDTGGNWEVEFSNCHVFGSSRSVISTTNKIAYIQCIISNGLHFTANPSSTTIQLSTFQDDCGSLISGRDITADVEITDVNYVSNIQQNGISGRIHTSSNVVNVGNDSVCRYYSIQDAIDSLTSGGLVFIAPGTYTEQIASKANITIQGYTTEGVPAKKSTIIYNTGVDAAHYPLRGNDDDYYVMNDVTIETNAGGVIGKIGAHKFSGCVFSKGHFIEATKNANMLLGLDNCTFLDSKAFDLTGVGSGGLRAMTIIGCFFDDHATHCKFDSTHTSTLAVVKNCIFHKCYPDVGGNWAMEMSDCHILGSSRSVISTTNKVTFIKCILSNGLHFTSNPDTIIQLCTFKDDCGYPITGEDITAAVTVTNVDYAQNVQQNGLAGEIQIQNPVKNVGGDAVNRYYTLQDAVTSVPTNDAGLVKIFEVITGLSELTLPTGADVTLDAQHIYDLTFSADIVEIGANQKCFFQNFVTLNGGEILVNGTAAELKFKGCGVVNGHITITDGSDVKIRRSGLVADTGFPAVTMNDLTCSFTFGYSKLQGATGEAAIKVIAECDGMIKGKFSTLISGTPASIAPILYTGAGKLDISLYNSALSGTFSAATMTNLIGSPNLTYDNGITY